MKARVKATGALLIVRPYNDSNFDWICDMAGEYGTLWKTEQLDFIDDFEPDYWEKLHHQAAIDFMKSFLNNYDGTVDLEMLLSNAIKVAKILVEKLKNEK